MGRNCIMPVYITEVLRTDIKRRKHSKPRFSITISKDQDRTLLISCLGKKSSSNTHANQNTDHSLTSVLPLNEGPQQAVQEYLQQEKVENIALSSLSHQRMAFQHLQLYKNTSKFPDMSFSSLLLDYMILNATNIMESWFN